MNDTSATSQPGASLLPEGTGAITTIHLVLILLVAIAAVAIIVAGIRRKRRRDEAARQVEQHAREAGIAPPDRASPPVAAAPPPPAIPASPPPIAPDESVAPDLPAPDIRTDEPIAAAAPLEASPATIAPDPAPLPAAASSADASPADGALTQLKGLGPKVATRLGELGITTIGQLAALDDDAATALDAQLGPFAGRLTRDRWIEQARFLSTGDRAGFEAVFGRL